MNKSDIFHNLNRFFNSMYPASPGHRPSCTQESYKGLLFDIFTKAYSVERIPGDEILSHLKEGWTSPGNLTEDDWDQIRKVCGMWSDWLYAWEKRDGVLGSADFKFELSYEKSN